MWSTSYYSKHENITYFIVPVKMTYSNLINLKILIFRTY